MNIIPFEKITDVPTGTEQQADVEASDELIDFMGKFSFQTLRATSESYFRGMSAYMFDARIRIGFDKNYRVIDVEFRSPFDFLGGDGLYWQDVNLLQPTIKAANDALQTAGVNTRQIDVGLESPAIGVSFLSSDYEGDLAVSLDAVTVHLHYPI